MLTIRECVDCASLDGSRKDEVIRDAFERASKLRAALEALNVETDGKIKVINEEVSLFYDPEMGRLTVKVKLDTTVPSARFFKREMLVVQKNKITTAETSCGFRGDFSTRGTKNRAVKNTVKYLKQQARAQGIIP